MTSIRMIRRRVALGVLVLSAVAAGLPLRAEPEAPDSTLRFHELDDRLGRLIATLLDEAPRLQAGRAAARATAAAVPVARSLADPELAYRVFAETPETRVGPQTMALELSQGIPWRHKRRLDGERVGRMATSEAWSVRGAERRAVAELKRSYYEASFLREALDLNAEETDLLRRFEQIALRRYSTGQGIQQSVIKVQTDLTRLADARSSLERRLATTLEGITRIVGSPAIEADGIPTRLPLPVADPTNGADEVPASHPELRAAAERVSAARIGVERRRLDTRPDFKVGLGYTRVDPRDDPAGRLSPPADNGKDVVALQLGVRLPVRRERIRGGIDDARERERAAEHALRDLRDGLDYLLRDATLRAVEARERAALYRDVLIPQAREALASAESAYVTDRLDFLDLLDAERILFQARLTHGRLVQDHWIALADLELALGRPFPQHGHVETDAPEDER